MSSVSATLDQMNALSSLDNLKENFVDSIYDTASYEMQHIATQRSNKSLQLKKATSKMMENIQYLEKKLDDQLSVSTPQRCKLKELDEEITNISKEIFGKDKQIETLKESNVVKEEDIKKKKVDLNAKETNINKKIESIENKLQFYEKYLGLKLEADEGSELLKFVFTCIDENDTEREFWFSVEIPEQENVYKVTECQPHLSNCESLVEELNINNDLKMFLCQVRKSFKSLCNKET